MAARKAIITGAATAGVAFASANPANTAAGAAGGGEGEWVNVLSSADVEDGRRLIFSGRGAARSDDDLIRAAECDIEAHDATRGALSLRGLGLGVDESQAKKLVDLGSSLAEDPRIQQVILEKMGLLQPHSQLNNDGKSDGKSDGGKGCLRKEEGAAALDVGMLVAKVVELQASLAESLDELEDQRDLNEHLNLHADRVLTLNDNLKEENVRLLQRSASRSGGGVGGAGGGAGRQAEEGKIADAAHVGEESEGLYLDRLDDASAVDDLAALLPHQRAPWAIPRGNVPSSAAPPPPNPPSALAPDGIWVKAALAVAAAVIAAALFLRKFR